MSALRSDSAPAASPLPFDDASEVQPEEIPLAQRRLLVHTEAMTATLAGFHGSTIDLDVLTQVHTPQGLTRTVVLRRHSDGAAIEFGAIAIDLELLPRSLWAPVLNGDVPFGRLLLDHGVDFNCRPYSYFAVAANSLLTRLLRVEPRQVLWGRRNRLFDSNERPFADVVEVVHVP